MTMLVSVVTITLNDLNGLRRTVDSVRSQTHAAVEHVVIDGGSTDGTPEWLEASGLAGWLSERDAGRYDAMNKGIARSQGDLIWFMNSGDMFAAPETIELAIDALGARGEWGYGFSEVVDATGRPTHVAAFAPFSLARLVLGRGFVPHQAAFFTRSLVDELPPYEPEFGHAADHLYILRAALVAAPVLVEQPLCIFDSTGVTSTRTPREQYGDVNRARRLTGAVVRGARRDFVSIFFACLRRYASLAARSVTGTRRSTTRRVS